MTDEHTWGDTQYDYTWPQNGLDKAEQILAYAHDSVEHVKNHEKYFIFKDYAEHIGIDKREHLAEWDPIVARVAKFNAEAAEKKEAEKKQREMDAEKRRLEQEAKEK